MEKFDKIMKISIKRKRKKRRVCITFMKTIQDFKIHFSDQGGLLKNFYHLEVVLWRRNEI